jgi:hypothetical protein
MHAKPSGEQNNKILLFFALKIFIVYCISGRQAWFSWLQLAVGFCLSFFCKQKANFATSAFVKLWLATRLFVSSEKIFLEWTQRHAMVVVHLRTRPCEQHFLLWANLGIGIKLVSPPGLDFSTHTSPGHAARTTIWSFFRSPMPLQKKNHNRLIHAIFEFI